METIIKYGNEYYLAEKVSDNCEDKCKGCPLNSRCADEENTSFCEEYGLQDNMHITKKINTEMIHYIDKDVAISEIQKINSRIKACKADTEYKKAVKQGRLIGYTDAIIAIRNLPEFGLKTKG